MVNVQDIVDELAAALERSVVVDDLDFRPIAASAQGDVIDALRIECLLQRSAPAPARELLGRLQIAQSRRPVHVDLRALDALDRLAIPIADDSGPLCILWLIVERLPPLTPAHYSAIDAAVLLVRAALSRQQPNDDSTARAAVTGRLLSDDAATARRAFSEAVAHGWLERGRGTAVIAVALDPEVGAVDRVAFTRNIDSFRDQAIASLGARGATQLFVTRALDTRPAVERIHAEAARRGLPIRAIGTGHHDRHDDELRTAADHAVIAAETIVQFPHLGRVADISELGTWLMLASIREETSRIALFSPAAYALCVDGDAIQRRTVETYLDVRSQVREACELLHIHRTTLYYRLENMPAVVKSALDDGVARSTLHLCLKLMRITETEERVQRENPGQISLTGVLCHRGA